MESPSRRVPGFPSLVAPRFDDLKVAGTRAELEILCYFDQWTPHGILDDSPIVWFSHGRSMSEQLIFSWGNCCQLFCNSEEGGYWFHMSKYDFTVDGKYWYPFAHILSICNRLLGHQRVLYFVNTDHLWPTISWSTGCLQQRLAVQVLLPVSQPHQGHGQITMRPCTAGQQGATSLDLETMEIRLYIIVVKL